MSKATSGSVSGELPGPVILSRIHEGLPTDTPWILRVVLRSRAFLVVALPVTLSLTIAALANPEWLLRIDQPLSDWVRGADGQLWVAKAVTDLGSPTLAVAFGIVGVVFFWSRCRASAITLGALVASALAVDIVLKLIVDRPRPISPAVDTALGSFPSGHVIHAVVIFGLVPFLLWVMTERRAFLRLGFGLFAVVTLSVAVSRVRLGAHWPSDVVTSLFIGASLLLAAEQMIISSWAADRCVQLGHHERKEAAPE